MGSILPAGTAACYHTDRRGSTVALTDSAGAVTDKYAYDDFGVPAGSTGSTPNAFRYLGGFGIYDSGDGTLFVRARHYHPDLGRFLSRDLLTGREAQPQSLNRYIYALNNPLALMDVSGFTALESNVAVTTPMISSDLRHRLLLSDVEFRANLELSLPAHPDGASIFDNIILAEEKSLLNPKDWFWFYSMVRNKGDWDYKQLSAEYRDFGNFNFGATGRAFGISENILLRGAGFAQVSSGNSPAGDDPNFWYYVEKVGGGTPYGDDPNDQVWIQRGFEFYNTINEF